MAEPTVDRVTLRREIARDLGMPFFRIFPSGITIQDSATSGLANASDSTKIKDSRFQQKADYWKNTWVYNVTTGEQRRTVDFIQDQKALMPEYNWTTTPTTAHTIEIFSIHTAEEVHNAINDAIRDGFPVFFDIVTYENIIIEDEKLEYTFSNNSDGRGFLTNPYRIKSVWMEQITSGGTHSVTSAASTVLANTAETFSGVDTTWSIGVYKGTGAGQYIVPTSGSSAGIITVPAMTVVPDTTSEFRLWKRTEELYSWYPITDIEFDAKDYPGLMRLLHSRPADVGLRMRIQYVQEPQPLATDTASTAVPRQYIRHRALAKLMRQRARTHPAERSKYAELATDEERQADKFKIEHGFDLPDQTIWQEKNWGTLQVPEFNPLDWGGR